MKKQSLWGDLTSPPEFNAPVTLLRDQAEFLEKVTNGVLEGKVKLERGDGSEMIVEFYVVAPYLGGYSFLLLRLYQPALGYPTRMFDLINDRECTAPNEEVFMDELSNILSSKKVTTAISMIKSQSVEPPF